MPFCYVGSYQTGGDAVGNNGIKIFFRNYGHGPVKILMITGLAGTHDSWLPPTPNDDQLSAVDRDDDQLRAVNRDGDDEGSVEVCAFDNRGMGRSSVPTKKSEYTTRIMAKDAIALMDHLGWRKAHVFGHSLGAMIACKLAALVPDRVLSLALLNVTGGGYECFPKLDRQTLSIAIRFLKAKTPEQRAAVDLETHYSKVDIVVHLEYHCPVLPHQDKIGALIWNTFVQEYVKGISASGMQSNDGFDGQINACWTHKMSRTELESIRSAGFLISVIHGRHDIIAQLHYAKRLAGKLQPFARMIELHGGHLVSHERTEEVNQALVELIDASERNISPYDWTNFPVESPGVGGDITADIKADSSFPKCKAQEAFSGYHNFLLAL
ncbi:alpha/beta-Hydrolases superfamily protein [Actinidia rufa]|uniref:Alpha/beta-Hydrolases superfamily protein n=1 Tax=Actinidia rufa TaxID=165716 RepID=A0A7J0DC98_9ERIC|nr:alpha/beta-Hydrolases superfamily protein [Actinidia rufa]